MPTPQALAAARHEGLCYGGLTSFAAGAQRTVDASRADGLEERLATPLERDALDVHLLEELALDGAARLGLLQQVEQRLARQRVGRPKEVGLRLLDAGRALVANAVNVHHLGPDVVLAHALRDRLAAVLRRVEVQVGRMRRPAGRASM